MRNPIDLYVGSRMRQRRRMLGMTQDTLAKAVSIRFQQVQKYESGANRVSASRLWALSKILDVPIAWFFDGIEERAYLFESQSDAPAGAPIDVFENKETIALIRAFYTLTDEPRRRLLELAQAMSETDQPVS